MTLAEMCAEEFKRLRVWSTPVNVNTYMLDEETSTITVILFKNGLWFTMHYDFFEDGRDMAPRAKMIANTLESSFLARLERQDAETSAPSSAK